MPILLEYALGFVIVFAVFIDVFSSVLVPRPSPRAVRVGPVLSRLLAPLWQRVAMRMPGSRLRQSVRASLAPALLLLSLGTWIALLTLGFAMMLHAQPEQLRLHHFGFVEALFQSALAISTLGLLQTDVLGWARLTVALAGLSGFSILTLVVAFLLSLQSALNRREALVLRLDARAGRPPTARALLGSMGGASDPVLAAFFEQWEAWTAEVEQSHLAYPVLFRFRSLHENGEWLTCLSAVLDFAALIRTAEPAGYPEATRAAGFLVTTAGRAIHEFGRVLSLPPVGPLREDADERDLLPLLAAGGMTPGNPAAWTERLGALRGAPAARLRQLAELLDLTWADTLLGGPGL